MEILRYKKLNPEAKAPIRGSKGAAGYDLSCLEDFTLLPGERKLLKTGLAISIPEQTYARVAPRSGNAYKAGIDVLAGVIDEDYRGDVGVILLNTSKGPGLLESIKLMLGMQAQPSNTYSAQKGDRIAQLVLEKISTPETQEVIDFEDTQRGEGGFGSTGLSSQE